MLLALSDSGNPTYESKHGGAIASLGCPVFACTPDQFPSMTASALSGKDLRSWAAEEDIALVRDLEGERLLASSSNARLSLLSGTSGLEGEGLP